MGRPKGRRVETAGARLDPIALDQPGDADGDDKDIGAARVRGDVGGVDVADGDGAPLA